MDDTERFRLEEEMAALREENRTLREQMVERLDVREFIAAATDTMRQIAHGQRVLFERYVQLWPDDTPPAEMVPEGPAAAQVGKLARPEWGTYQGMHQHLLELQTETKLKPKDVTKELLAGLAGVHPRTLVRRMRDYGLDPKRHWPPSTWPEYPPRRRMAEQLDLLGRHLAPAVVGLWGVIEGVCLHRGGTHHLFT